MMGGAVRKQWGGGRGGSGGSGYDVRWQWCQRRPVVAWWSWLVAKAKAESGRGRAAEVHLQQWQANPATGGRRVNCLPDVRV